MTTQIYAEDCSINPKYGIHSWQQQVNPDGAEVTDEVCSRCGTPRMTTLDEPIDPFAEELAFIAINGLNSMAGEDQITADDWSCASETNETDVNECREVREMLTRGVGVPLLELVRSRYLLLPTGGHERDQHGRYLPQLGAIRPVPDNAWGREHATHVRKSITWPVSDQPNDQWPSYYGPWAEVPTP